MSSYRFLKVIIVAACLWMLPSCDGFWEDDNSGESIELSASQEKMVKAGNELGFRMMENLNAAGTSTLVSPYGVSQLLGMLSSGATGETRLQICYVAGFPGAGESEVNEFFKAMNKGLDPKNGVNMSIANSLWTATRFPVKRDYVSECSKYYVATAQTVDFSKKSTLTTINKWCSKATDGLIATMFPSLSEQMDMLLLNTGCLDAQWASKFKKTATQKAEFTCADGSKRTKDFMQQVNKGDFRCYVGSEAAMLEMPYLNRMYSMVCVLPGEGSNLEQLLGNLTSDKWADWTARLSDETACQVFLPKFEIAYEGDLVPVLKGMGLTLPFAEGAQFGNIAEGSMCLSDMRQKSIITVEEDRTLVVASTSSVVQPTGITINKENITFRFDEPFIFAIRERSTGAILFLGTVVD